jgi:hypothetical protein
MPHSDQFLSDNLKSKRSVKANNHPLTFSTLNWGIETIGGSEWNHIFSTFIYAIYLLTKFIIQIYNLITLFKTSNKYEISPIFQPVSF